MDYFIGLILAVRLVSGEPQYYTEMAVFPDQKTCVTEIVAYGQYVKENARYDVVVKGACVPVSAMTTLYARTASND